MNKSWKINEGLKKLIYNLLRSPATLKALKLVGDKHPRQHSAFTLENLEGDFYVSPAPTIAPPKWKTIKAAGLIWEYCNQSYIMFSLLAVSGSQHHHVSAWRSTGGLTGAGSLGPAGRSTGGSTPPWLYRSRLFRRCSFGFGHCTCWWFRRPWRPVPHRSICPPWCIRILRSLEELAHLLLLQHLLIHLLIHLLLLQW